MGAPQKTILTKTPSWAGSVDGKTLKGTVGGLGIGKPGDITSRAFGPVVYSGILAAETEFGTFVTGKGILVNSNDVANLANYDENYKAKAGQTVGFLTYGTCVVKGSNVAAIATAMNARVLYGAGETATAKAVGTGVTGATVVAGTFGGKVAGVSGTYEFVATVADSSATWKLGETTVTLATYGITATGAAADGDKIIVTYDNDYVDIEVAGFKAAE